MLTHDRAMLRDVLFYSVFGSGFAIVTMVLVGIVRFGADAPKLFRPEKDDVGFTVALLAAASAFWAVVLAMNAPLWRG